MASVITLPAYGTIPRERSPARAAFARVFNLRSIAVVFYFCFVLLLGRFVIGLSYEPLDIWAFNLVRYLRQTMISATLLLLAIACVESFVAARQLSARAALTLGIAVSVLAAAVALPIRVWVAGSPMSSMAKEPFYFLQIWTLWSAVGCIGYWLFHTINSEESSRTQLADAECRRESLQAQMVEARLSALQAQIEPHFLFNTLANVKRLYETAPAAGSRNAFEPDQLSASGTADHARTGIDTRHANSNWCGPFSRSCRCAWATGWRSRSIRRRTSAPHACRRWCCPRWSRTRSSMACRRCPKAAASTSARSWTVTGNWSSRSPITARASPASGGSGVGLANTRSRLAALYGTDASLALSMASPRGVVATVRLPLQFQESPV